MRAGQPNLGKEWEQIPAVDYGGGDLLISGEEGG